MKDDPLDTVAFAERLLALLDEGRRSSTYKLAVLLALAELCFEKTNKYGEPPDMVTTAELARKVIEIYWRQSVKYPKTGNILDQNQGKSQERGQRLSAKIVREIANFRAKSPSLTLHEARLQRGASMDRLARSVEQTLIKMPLPKLQRLDGVEHAVVYEIGWDNGVRPGTWTGTQGFDNRVRFVDGAAKNLVRLSGLLRPLIQEKWTSMVAEINHLDVGALNRFLFDMDRTALSRVASPLEDLQEGRCFYCQEPMGRRHPHVDHFIPWSRHADDGLDNLVVAHEQCNLAKRNFLAAGQHVARWRRRSRDDGAKLEYIAAHCRWPRAMERTLGIARATYEIIPGGLLWLAGREFESPDPAALRRILAE